MVKLLISKCGHVPDEIGIPICGEKNHQCFPVWDPWGCGSYCGEGKEITCKKCKELVDSGKFNGVEVG